MAELIVLVDLLKVKDDNDHSPVFDADIYEASIEENNRQGAVLFRVTANDQDIGDNGRIDYSINGEVERFVTVDRESGLVRAAVSLDRELVSELNIYLTATDRGQPSRSASTRLHLVVLDVDDNGPEFDATRFRLRVAENQPARTEVSINHLPKLCVKISILRHRGMWVRSFSTRLTSVTFAEDKVLIFLILCKNAKIVQL